LPTAGGGLPQAPRSFAPPLSVRPCGTAASMAERTRDSESGRSFAVRFVRAATMPQPISTPTAAGITAPRVAITEPTVAPMPKCTSGMIATCWCTNGSDATRSTCARASSSNGTPSTHALIGAPELRMTCIEAVRAYVQTRPVQRSLDSSRDVAPEAGAGPALSRIDTDRRARCKLAEREPRKKNHDHEC
jgi:hypothetical protein